QGRHRRRLLPLHRRTPDLPRSHPGRGHEPQRGLVPVPASHVMIQLISILAALAVVVAAYAIYAYSGTVIDDKRALRSRLESARTDQIADPDTPTDILKDDSFSSVASVDALLQKLSVSDWLQRLLVQAGSKMQ